MLKASECLPGKEQYESFLRRVGVGYSKKRFVQYDYRAPDGVLFSCVRRTLAECRKERDLWELRRACKGDGCGC